jgi:hypothetical protein
MEEREREGVGDLYSDILIRRLRGID